MVEILVVESWVILRNGLSVVLEQLGYSPVAVGNAAAALGELKNFHDKISLVVIGYARLDGEDQAIVEAAQEHKIPVVLMAYPRDTIPSGLASFSPDDASKRDIARIVEENRRR